MKKPIAKRKQKPIRVPDIPGPYSQLCWTQAPNMVRCDRRAKHGGRHSWESAETIDRLAAEIVRLETDYIAVMAEGARLLEECQKAHGC